MNKELFGVFGDIETFVRFRSVDEFDRVFEGATVTAGIRDSGLGAPGWSDWYEGADGWCLVWGEAYTPDGVETPTARWLFERYDTEGLDALTELNGSYLVALEIDGEAVVATDPMRSRECFYTDEPGVRVFGSDAAAVAPTIDDPTPNRDGILEFLHLGVTLGTKTALEGLDRLPLDSRLTPTSVDPFDRFVYRPQRFDYVSELAERLERALRRRSTLPGEKGVLLSAGYDSRVILSQIVDIDRCYTVGAPDDQEVRGARRLARQYGAIHTAFRPDDRYLLADESKVRYSQGIKESLHIHHAGYTDEIDTDTVYHGLLCDTFFRGHFTAHKEFEVLGKRIPLGRLEPDPDPVGVLLERFGYSRDASEALAACTSFDVEPEAFARAAVADEFEAMTERAGTAQNALTCCGIANQPSIPFHTQLSDRFFASFLATDIELIDWHLRTPPEHRTTETFLRASERLDADILRHRPPDRPHGTQLLNEAEGFIRRKTPFLSSFEPPWPDREALFDRHGLDERLLADLEHVHALPARHKLRLNDVLGWFECWSTPRDRAVPWVGAPAGSR